MSVAPADVLGETELCVVRKVLQRACGLSLSKVLGHNLASSFVSAAGRTGLDPRRFLDALRRGDPASVAALVDSSVVGETYFFRHPEQFRALREVLQLQSSRGRPLAIWSAGCASGEEPYSMAMLLLEAGRAACRDRILATDISSQAIAAARQGVYGGWSLRRIDPGVRGRYLRGENGRVEVMPEVRERVTFRRHNLVLDPPPGRFNLILCRNVLIYFEAQTSARVLHELVGALDEGGLLVLGHAELPLASTLGLEWLDIQDTTLLRKPASADRRQAARPRSPPRNTPAPRLRRGPDRTCAPPSPKPAAPGSTLFEQARDAARTGDLERAERLARQAGEGHLLPEAHLLLSMTAEARGDLEAAVDAARRALYLDPGLAVAHAMLVPLYGRLGRAGEAERARRNAKRALAQLDDGAPLRGVESITAGALRRALEPGP